MRSSLSEISEQRGKPLRPLGEVSFLGREARGALSVARASENWIVIALESLGPNARGRLADAIDDVIERELDARGAAAPGIGAGSDPDATLSDQLFRARQVGARGLCFTLGSLAGIASPRGALEVEDSATLRFLAGAARERPIALLFDTTDARRGAFAEPVALEVLLRGAPFASEHTSEPPTVRVEPPPPEKPSAFVGGSVAREADSWRHWALRLAAARGPQSLGAFERLFFESYLPLGNAITEGLTDSRALSAHDEFQRTFVKSYTDACPTFAITGKRPKMVLDAPDIAGRMARLHGARTTQLLLVDSMRWDLGQTVKHRLVDLLGARASLTDENVLFSALPSTTSRQLETIGRGVDALRSRHTDPEIEPLRGRTSEYVRRLRVGQRELLKLDLVASRLRDAEENAAAILPDVAETVARIIARHAESFAPRTLLFVFGDHGFTIDRGGAARHGGATPEEVIVPAFAFLVGDPH